MNNIFKLSEVVELIKHIVDEFELRFYDLYFNEVNNSFRIFIDREDGTVSVDDCKKVSKSIARALDQSDLVTFAYILEVSSPGILSGQKVRLWK
jgi:ribosome maturation factor RimP